MKINLLIILLLCTTFVLIGCEKAGEYSDSSENGDEILQTGVASWYGPGFDGRLTSSRERYDQNKLTAAHRTLPFNTVVEVINSETGESVEVTINDRGPYSRGRIIDLSKAAAEEIDLLDKGVAEVDLVLIEAGGTMPEDLDRSTYTIQLGEYNLERYAERFAESVGDGVRIEQRFPQGTNRAVFMIYYGNYNNISSAREDLQQLEERGFEGLVRQI